MQISVAITEGTSEFPHGFHWQATVSDVLAGIVGTICAGANKECSISCINEARVGDYFVHCELVASAGASWWPHH